MSMREPRINLIPWDYDSPEHVERMFIQRLACGWRSHEVQPLWVELCRAKKKLLYWVVLEEDLPDKEDIISKHLAENPKESIPIKDTAPTHWHLPRQPSHSPMIPIGHIALDLRPEEDARLPALVDNEGGSSSSSKNNIVWVAGLFVSQALQSRGFGREVMRAAETIAGQTEPLNAGWIVLDTMPREQQLSGGFTKAMYAELGRPVPEIAAQDWYERQGFIVFAEEKNTYTWVSPVTGERQELNKVFLRKKVSG